MATGVSGLERLGRDALTAGSPHREPGQLPPSHVVPTLTYPQLLTRSDVLAPIPSPFVSVGRDGGTAPSAIAPNALALTDNLFGLHDLLGSGARVTMLYLDPPYNTGFDFQSRQLEHSYNDRRGIAAYVEWMRRRLILMHEILTVDGSIYIHIDHRMLSYLKVVMDEVFGADNFRNIIARRKCSSKNFTKNQYLNLNDYILFYTKSGSYKWNQPGERPTEEWIEKEYPKRDARGRYKLVPVHAPGTRHGETGSLWRGKAPPPGKHWQYTPSTLDELDQAGDMHWSRNGNPRRKLYLTQDKLVAYSDYWAGFRDAHHQSIQVTGYPTEKNLDMLKMIIGASSDPGDLVVDPFCGSGTTLQAAEDLGRRWVGFDDSFAAVRASLKRLRHGTEPMGDFVERPERPRRSADLFDQDLAAAPSRSPRRETAAFDFLVDAELNARLPDEIRALASI